MQPIIPDLEKICQRVRDKATSYQRYNFSRQFNDILKAFFDLAQEFDALFDFYRICVAVPLEMAGVHSSLYLYEERQRRLGLVCDSFQGVHSEPAAPPPGLTLKKVAYELGDAFVIPIYSKPPLSLSLGDTIGTRPSMDRRQKFLWCGSDGVCGRTRILGMFAVGPLAKIDDADRFFFAKYANRIGYNLHNRLIAHQNIDHLKFINTLVMDIEHNVIVPNMYFKHLFNQLRKEITELEKLKDLVRQLAHQHADQGSSELTIDKCDRLHANLLHYQQELVKHHANVTLFLESLFRREHFEKGHLVLHPKRCFIEKEVILPQLEHYASRLRAANVTIERPRNMIKEEFAIRVDIGLLAQVYANLFSNAAKYAREIRDHQGNPRKALAYGREIVDNFPEPGKQGVKFNVFTTGPHFPPEVQAQLFSEGFRGPDTENIPGTGHGLSFIKHVIELHGGQVGYEATAEGNNFYFILPISSLDLPADGFPSQDASR